MKSEIIIERKSRKNYVKKQNPPNISYLLNKDDTKSLNSHSSNKCLLLVLNAHCKREVKMKIEHAFEKQPTIYL